MTILTVSIVTYHTPLHILQNTVDSLHRCTVPHAVIIMDNSMNAEYFSRLQRANLAPCIATPYNGGYGYGHNQALSYLPTAPYHLVLNPDVVIHPGCIESLLEVMEKSPDIGLTSPKILYADGRLQPLNKYDPTVYDLCLRRFVPKFLQAIPFIRRRMQRFVMMDKGYDKSHEIEYASGCFMLFRRSVLDAIGGFDEQFFLHFEDADITRRTRTLARVVYVPQGSITHLWARISHKPGTFTFITLQSAYWYFRKWGWKWH